MRKTLLAAAVAASFAAPVAVTTAQAQQAAAPASPHTLTGNLTIASDYRFRGISQTFKGPTIQGGIDYSHASGFYLGNWNSNVSGLQYNNGNNIEMDFYGGWKGSWGDWGLDVGALYYYYDSARWNGLGAANNLAALGTAANNGKYNNGELYIAGSWKFISAKYSYAVTDYFGLNGSQARGLLSKDCAAAFPAPAGCVNLANFNLRGAGQLSAFNEDRGSSKGTGYFQIDFNYEVAPKTTIVGHVGKLTVKNYGELSYTDAKLGVNYDWNGWVLGAAVVGTNANKQWYYAQRALGNGAAPTISQRTLGDTTLVLSVTKSF